MSRPLSDSVVYFTKQLIQHISGYNEDTEIFRHIEKYAYSHLQCADSMFFVNQKELDRVVKSLSEKFAFHGFLSQAKELKRVYDKLIPQEGLAKQERLNRLNVIKFLLDVSQSPTNNFQKYPQHFEKGDDEEVIDWPAYLTEGIDRWSPPVDEESECWSDNSSDITSSVADEDVVDHKFKTELDLNSKIHGDGLDSIVLYHNSKANLLKNVQSEWFNKDYVCFKPTSEDRDANLALLWDGFINSTTKGLVPTQSSHIISEYKIVREVIWQFYEPHLSSCFSFLGNSLVPKVNVTISSVRKESFESFLHEFMPYIEWLQMLREFHESINATFGDNSPISPPDTYRSYDFALQSIIGPIVDALKLIEQKIKQQETTTTLLTLANELRPLFQIVRILKNIHQNVILDFKQQSPLKCATVLLYRLRKGLLYTSSKLEQDLYLMLYLHSLYKYFTIVNSWLVRDVLEDYTGEFVIADENPKDSHVLFNNSVGRDNCTNNQTIPNMSSKIQQGEQDWQMDFRIKELDEDIKSDGIINIICTHVLQIGKNVHLLRLLGKLHLVPEFTGVNKETLYESYTNRILAHISRYFNPETKDSSDSDVFKKDDSISEVTTPQSPTFIFPVTCPEECKYLTELDKLENLINTSNGFLVKSFEAFLVKKPNANESAEVHQTLFEKIKGQSEAFFPIRQILENVLLELLKERFSVSGLMVKNVLINEYHLRTQFSFLKHIFLFEDDLIFPLYRHIFNQLDKDGIWGNQLRLTSQLQDIIIDLYPNFYDKCSIDIKDSWKIVVDPLKACKMITMQYKIVWPVNIIIRDEHIEMYKELFQFILMIKWALYTLNHLYFSELEPKRKSRKPQPKPLRMLISKLKILRFGLVNIFSSVQHFVLGHIFVKHSIQFEKSFQDTYDLESLINAHTNFISSLHKDCIDLRDFNSTNYGFYMLLYLVQKLRKMWRNLVDVNDEELDKCENYYLLCHKELDPIINPTYNACMQRKGDK